MLNDLFLYPDDGQFGDLPGQSDREEEGEEEGKEGKKEEKENDDEDAIEEEEE